MSDQEHNYLYTLYMDYRKSGPRDPKEEAKLTKRAKKMHSEMVWYPRFFTGFFIFVTILLLGMAIFGLFFKDDPMSLSDVFVACITIYISTFIAINKTKVLYHHSLDNSELMKSTREQAIYGILTGNFNAIVESPTEIVCECGFVMKPEAGFCNECGKKNTRQVSPMANGNPVETNPVLSKLTKPTMPTMMVVVLVMIALLCVWGVGRISQMNESEENNATAQDTNNNATAQGANNVVSQTQRPDAPVTILDVTLLTGAKGDYVEVEYQWTNTYAETHCPSYSVSCTAYQNGTKLVSNTNQHEDDSTYQNRTVDISPGSSIIVKEAFYLINDSDVTIEIKRWSATEDSTPEAQVVLAIDGSTVTETLPTVETPEEPTTEIKGDIKSQTSLKENLDNFGPILYQIGTNLTKNNSYNDYVNQDMSGVLTYYEQDNVGYAFVDVNYDGVDELILGSLSYPSGSLISMYYLSSSGIVSAVHGEEREHYTLCKDGVILYSGSGSATEMTTYSVELTQYGMNVVNDDRAKDYFNLTDEYIPNYTPLSEYFGDSSVYTEDTVYYGGGVEETNEYDAYDSIINQVTSMVFEDYSYHDYTSNGFSGTFSYYFPGEIEFALYDINGDGIEELFFVDHYFPDVVLAMYYWDGQTAKSAFNSSEEIWHFVFHDGVIAQSYFDEITSYILTNSGLVQVTDHRAKSASEFSADGNILYFQGITLSDWWYA